MTLEFWKRCKEKLLFKKDFNVFITFWCIWSDLKLDKVARKGWGTSRLSWLTDWPHAQPSSNKDKDTLVRKTRKTEKQVEPQPLSETTQEWKMMPNWQQPICQHPPPPGPDNWKAKTFKPESKVRHLDEQLSESICARPCDTHSAH